MSAIPPVSWTIGVWVSQHEEIPPRPVEEGYLSDTCVIPHENKAKKVRYPSLRYYLESEKVLRDVAMWGGMLHWAAKKVHLLF